MKDGGFCVQGGIDPKWELSRQTDGLNVWGSFCRYYNADTGHIESAKFLAPPTLTFFLAGYVGNPGLRLFLRNLETGVEFDLHPPTIPGENWQRSSFELPVAWVGKPVQMVAEDRSTTDFGWLAFTAPRLPYAMLAAGDITTSGPQTGFCRSLPSAQNTQPGGAPPGHVTAWRSYCSAGDNDTGWMASQPFIARSKLPLYVTGYPGSPEIRLALQNLNTLRQLPLQFDTVPAETWRLYYFPLPPEWKGQPVRLLAEDRATRPGGWVGFAEVSPRQGKNNFSFGVRLVAFIVFLFIATMLPATAACIIAALRGAKTSLDLAAIALLTIGFVGYSSFWTYFWSRTAGFVFSYLILLSSCAIVLWSLIRPEYRPKLAALQRLLVPLTLLATASIFMVSIGFLYGKPDVVQDYAVYRFGLTFLSIDNFLPKLLADAVYSGHIAKPMVGDWLSSDRPPLQAGMALWHYGWTHGNRDLAYQVLGTIWQLTFLAGLWAYLDTAGVNVGVTGLALIVSLFSGFTFVNSFFVWPKLLPVAFLLIMLAYLFTGRYYLSRTSWRAGVAVGAAAAFAMLCHGGSIFGLLGIGIATLLLRRVPSPRFLLAAAAAAILLYLPWSLYQKYYDPPGDRLLKMHLAGVGAPHPEIKLSDLVVSKYKSLGWKGVEYCKKSNFKAVVNPDPYLPHPMATLGSLFTGDSLQRSAAVMELRETMFFRWLWSLDVFGLVPILWIMWAVFRRRSSPEYQQAWMLWLCTVIVLIVWCLLMLGPGVTCVHQGCYFTEIVAFAGAVLGLWAISPRLAAIVTACHVVFNVVVYILFLTPPQSVGFASYFGPVNPVLACASAISGLAFMLTLWPRAGRTGSESAVA